MKKYAAAALAAVTAAGMLGGCKQLEEKAPEDTVAVKFGDTDIMLDEIEYMVRSMEYSYEAYFGSEICSSDMGDGSGMTVGDYIVETCLTQLRQTLVLNEYAKQNGIELSESQQQLVADQIDKLYEEGQEYLDAVGGTAELVEKLYTQNAVANLAYLKLVEDVDTTVGDDEFLRKRIAYVKLTPSELTETTAAVESTSSEEASSESDTEAAGSEAAESEAAESEIEESETAESETTEAETSETETTVPETEEETESEIETSASSEQETEAETLSEEEQERLDAMNDAAQKILKEFENGSDAADFISDYQNDSHFTATNSEISISEEGTAVYVADAWKLSTDECTIFNSEDGSIYIIRCLDDNDEEARQSAIDSEIESRKTDLFKEKYAEIQDASSKFKVDEDVIKTIRFTEPVYVPETEEETSEPASAEAESSEEETAAESSEEASSEEMSSTEEQTEHASEEEESTGAKAFAPDINMIRI